MSKKILLMLIITALVTTGAFAQANTITVDFGPTIIGVSWAAVGRIMENALAEDDLDGSGVSTSGFGIGLQYEREILDRISVAGRFAYLGIGMGMTFQEGNVSANANMDISSFSLEAHGRYYINRSLFADGMLGYARMTLGIGGQLIGEVAGNTEKIDANLTVSRNYFKIGAKVGWRIDFGAPGGLILEHSYGWYGAAGLGNSFGKQILGKLDGVDVEILDEGLGYLENFLFVGGPRMTLALGWRF
jgi:hypothetical protein